ncbi:MAG: DUF2203 domain-containing protein [Pyrinomonadaceae bacterium]
MKLFSLEEANVLLPSVRRIVASLTRAHAYVASRKADARRAGEIGAESGGGHLDESSKYIRVVLTLIEKTSELDSLGVQLKDYSIGLIDFPSMREGRIVLLCWKLGEGDRIEWWHETEAGYAGRQPL